jgi:hypothetical protein
LTEQAQQAVALSAVVAQAAQEVALALRGGGDSFALARVLRPEDPLTPAAVRVLGADVLAPYALEGAVSASGQDAEPVRAAISAFAPGADASDVSVWSYRGLVEAAHAFLPHDAGAWPQLPDASAAWTTTVPWPVLSHRAAQLASLALPGLDSEPARGLATRGVDLSRGFVRAVRRRDWVQAAGLGRWLARLPDTPPSLGLDSGLTFVRAMSDDDPRVALHVMAARRFYGRGV